jgi:hypothetical protein
MENNENKSLSLESMAKNPTTPWVALIVYVVLQQFGLVGPDAEAKFREEESRWQSMEMQIVEMRAEVKSVSNQLRGMSTDYWRSADMRLWASELKARNPEIDIPELN